MTRADKAARHVVTPNTALRAFLVRSGSSGKTYTVVPVGVVGAMCTCDGWRWRGTDCSHIRAVRMFAERALKSAS